MTASDRGFDFQSDIVRAIPLDDSGNGVTIPDAHFLFHAEFKRTGSDLTLIGQDGQKLVVPGYFKHEKLPALFAPDGSALTSPVPTRPSASIPAWVMCIT
jgi:fibronectin-binding autotransporter adhesin